MDTDDRNYYLQTAGAPLHLSPLSGDVDADVCIVGAGFTGLAAAHFLQRAGAKIVVLEQHEVGWGASGRNGGQVLPGFFADIRDVFRGAGFEKGLRLWDLSVEGIAIVRALIGQYSISCDWRDGALTTAGSAAEDADLEAYADFLEKNCGARRALWDRQKLASEVGNEAYRKGLYDANAGHFHTLKYIRGLARALADKGVAIHEKSLAREIVNVAGGHRTSTPGGAVNAKTIVLCGDSYQGTLVPELRRKYIVINNAILATAPLANPGALLNCNAAVSESSAALHFYRKTADNRLLFGGGDTVIPGRSDRATRAKTLAILRGNMIGLFPELAATPISHQWSGSIAITSSFMPNVGRLKSGAWYANGFSGHGVNLTHVIGKLLADAVAGGDETYKLFGAVRNLSFPGCGRFDYPLTVLGMWRYRLAHALDRLF
jgi:gamma-glutamylputrescine oxidase